MKNLPLLLGTILGTLILVFGIAFLFSEDTTQTGQVLADPATVVGDARHAQGPAAAPVTVVEFSDFQCPACKAAQPLVKQLTAEYPEQVRVVYRHFPLDQIHPNARTAAQAAEVAAQYGKFWEYHDLLFQNQESWSGVRDRETFKSRLGDYAAQLEIDKTEFTSKIENQDVVDAVQADVAAGLQAGVNATPTFYVNGVQTTAPQLRATVESALSQAEAQ